MAETNAERSEVNARIVYWGIEGAGKSTNLHTIHGKLRPDHRGRLEQVPTRLDPSVTFHTMRIELGEIAGTRTRIQVIAVPGAPENAPTRKQLLDRVDGIVLVVDARRDRIDENVAAFEELRSGLAAYGRNLEEVPLVVQYNKQDLADPFVLEELHRKLDVRGAAAFESVATEGTGVLQTLTTISKRVVRTLRESPPPVGPRPPTPSRAQTAVLLPDPDEESPPALVQDLQQAALTEADGSEADASAGRAESLLDASWGEMASGPDEPTLTPELAPEGDWRIASASPPEVVGGRSLRVPLVLADRDGRELRFQLTVSLDPLLDE